MKYGPLGYTVVPHEDGVFAHHLEIGPFPSDFFLPSVPGPGLRIYEEIRHSREVIGVFENYIVEFTCVIFQVQVNGAYPLGFDDPPDAN